MAQRQWPSTYFHPSWLYTVVWLPRPEVTTETFSPGTPKRPFVMSAPLVRKSKPPTANVTRVGAVAFVQRVEGGNETVSVFLEAVAWTTDAVGGESAM